MLLTNFSLPSFSGDINVCEKEISGQLVANELMVHIFSFLDDNDRKNVREVCHLWKNIIDTHPVKLKVMVIGPTGSGKSTLINLMCGQEITAFNYIENSWELRLEAMSEVRDICISHGFSSKTLSITCAKDYERNRVIYDTPGFFDTRGSIQDEQNLNSIKNLLPKVKVVILISSINIFDDQYNSNLVLDFLQNIVSIFDNNINLMKKIIPCLILSKIESLDDSIITDIQLDKGRFDKSFHDVIGFFNFLREKKCVYLFPKPKKIGVYNASNELINALNHYCGKDRL